MPGEGALSDEVLLQRVAGGDDVAFETFLDRHEAAALRYIRAATSDDHAAADALQETFIAAWRHAHTFRGDASARAWVLGIARNAVRRQFRRRAGEPRDTEPLTALGAAAGWGADPLARIEARDVVAAAFARLGPDDREILVLRELEGLSGEETAEVLELSITAMKSRLHRARLRFMAAVREVS